MRTQETKADTKGECDYCGKLIAKSKLQIVMGKDGFTEMLACPQCEERVYSSRGQQDYYNQFDPMED